jgi:hypothetical protein
LGVWADTIIGNAKNSRPHAVQAKLRMIRVSSGAKE